MSSDRYGTAEPLFTILIVFLILGWISCLLRAWVKTVILKKIAIDDYLMLGAVLFYTGYAISGLVGVVDGLGRIDQGMTLSEEATGLRSWWLCEVLYSPLTLLGRSSVAVFMLRIAVQSSHRRIIIGTMATFCLVTIPLFIIMVFQCRPVSYFWMRAYPTEPRGICLNTQAIFLVSVLHSAISACCDWVLSAMPMVMLWKVQLNKRTKFALSLLLGMGFFAGIALIVRISYVRYFDNSDFLAQSINVANWSILEPGICIVAGCIATLRPLFSHNGISGRAVPSSRSLNLRNVSGQSRCNGVSSGKQASFGESNAFIRSLAQLATHDGKQNLQKLTANLKKVDTMTLQNIHNHNDTDTRHHDTNGTAAYDKDDSLTITRKSKMAPDASDKEPLPKSPSPALLILQPPDVSYQGPTKRLQCAQRQYFDVETTKGSPLACHTLTTSVLPLPSSLAVPLSSSGHILVQTATKVEYDYPVQNVSSMSEGSLPTSGCKGTTNSLAIVDPKLGPFRGGRHVQITGCSAEPNGAD